MSPINAFRDMSPADNLCKQFGPRSGPTKCQAWSGSKLFDILRVFLKDVFEKCNWWKNNSEKTNMQHFSAGKDLKGCIFISVYLIELYVLQENLICHF